jgi:LacI family transcriptional regulator
VRFLPDLLEELAGLAFLAGLAWFLLREPSWSVGIGCGLFFVLAMLLRDGWAAIAHPGAFPPDQHGHDRDRAGLRRAQDPPTRPPGPALGALLDEPAQGGVPVDVAVQVPAAQGRCAEGAAHVEQEQSPHLLFVCETEGDPKVEVRLVEDLLGRQVDGFMYAAMYTRQVQIPRALRDHPLVLLNCTTRDARIPAVLPDEVGAGRSAAQALLERGHRDGIHVVGEPNVDVFASRERMVGILEALSGAGAGLAGVLDCAWQPEAVYDAVSEMLRHGGRPGALICMNDRVALGAYQALQEAGVAIPGEVSVVSFDDSELARWLRPKLTSVALPHHEMGRHAVELLLSEHPATEIERVTMPLRERLSVGPPRTPARTRAERRA